MIGRMNLQGTQLRVTLVSSKIKPRNILRAYHKAYKNRIYKKQVTNQKIIFYELQHLPN